MREGNILARAVSGMTAEQFILAAHTFVSNTALKVLQHYIRRRVTGMPLQYITRTTHFWGHEFTVCPGVFIPRPETEMLVEKTIAFIDEHSPITSRVAEPYAGCGAVAIAVAIERPSVKVIASDVSRLAVAIAKHNSHFLKVNIPVLRGTNMDRFTGRFEVIIANPPYIPTASLPRLQLEILHEPIAALDGGTDGLECFRSLLSQLPHCLATPGLALIELAPDNVLKAATMTEYTMPYAKVEVLRDFARLNRFLQIRLVSA